MPQVEVLAEKPQSTEEKVRTIFLRHMQRLTEVLLTPECHAMIEENIRQMGAILRLLKDEAARKKRSPEYTALCESMLAEAVTSEVGPLAKLHDDDLDAFERLLDTIISGMANKVPEF